MSETKKKKNHGLDIRAIKYLILCLENLIWIGVNQINSG